MGRLRAAKNYACANMPYFELRLGNLWSGLTNLNCKFYSFPPCQPKSGGKLLNFGFEIRSVVFLKQRNLNVITFRAAKLLGAV